MPTQTTKSSWNESIAKVDLIDDIIQWVSKQWEIKNKSDFQKYANEMALIVSGAISSQGGVGSSQALVAFDLLFYPQEDFLACVGDGCLV